MTNQELRDRGNNMEKFRLIDRYRIPTYDNPKHMKTANLNFDMEKCKQCGICISLCPGGCILTESVTKKDYMNGTVKSGKCGNLFLDSIKPGVTLCIACFDCGAACPHGAISIKSNFNAGYFFKKLTQTSDMKYPKRY